MEAGAALRHGEQAEVQVAAEFLLRVPHADAEPWLRAKRGRWHAERGLVYAVPDRVDGGPADAGAQTDQASASVVVNDTVNQPPTADAGSDQIVNEASVVTLTGLAGERRLPLDQFFKGPRLTALAPGEMMTSIFVPFPPAHSGSSYQHLSARGKVDISAVCVGVMAAFNGETCREVRIVLGAVAPVPLRAFKAEALLQGQPWTPELRSRAGDQAGEEAQPISDVRASAAYRKKMVPVLTRRALVEAQKRARKR